MELNIKQIVRERAKRILWIANKTTEKIVKKELNKMRKDLNKLILNKLKEK